ncbi:MFS transporter [Saccharibacillus sp. CPCC 101409]|uniref:MFS transporter n=1 Tax=Saccharibacillus sp. CPCC 101409 TaxID=3058041 RepID=UPI0026740B2D|nr:MFS transporter [Saccharibacillus sp. CPCC 101409]MDO3411193.1 MFS transporter [Saccharibacillus sp. CPCC 101409]
MKKLVWMGSLFYLLMGFIKVTVASILTVLLPMYDRMYTDAGTLIFIEFGASIVGMLIQPWLANNMSKKKMLHIGAWGVAASYLLIAFLPPWSVLLVGIAVAGFLGGIIESVIAAVILEGLQSNAAIAMSRLEIAFGVGSLMLPLAIGVLIHSGLWNYALFGIAGYCVLLSAFVRFTRFNEAEALFLPAHQAEVPSAVPAGAASSGPVGAVVAAAATHHPSARNKRIRRAPGAWMLPAFILLFFLYGATDIGLVNYLPSLMLETGMADAGTAPISVTVFWAAMIAGRMFAGYEAERIGYRKYLFIHWIGMIALLALFAVNRSAAVGYVLIVLLGLTLSGLYVVTLVYSKTLMPRNIARNTSILMAGCAIGGGLFSVTAGRMLDTLPPSYVQWMMAGIAVLSLLTYIAYAKERHAAHTQTLREPASSQAQA